MEMNKRRNVVVIMCDQLRPDFLNAYGADFIPTPNIDALAENGVVMDNAITAATVCGPARMSFLTGRHVSDHGTWTNLIPPREDCEFLPERFVENGYMTAAVGCYDHAPDEKTFGYKYMIRDLGDGPNCDYKKYMQEKHPEYVWRWTAGDETGHFMYDEEDYFDRWSADRATEFIESYTKTGAAPDGTKPEEDGAPFYLYCGFFGPHMPEIPPKEVAGTVDKDKIPQVLVQPRPDEDIAPVELYRRAWLNPLEYANDPHSLDDARMKQRLLYCEMIVEIDNLVGRIVKSLKDNGIYDNTTIIFTSDHGSVDNDYGMVSKGPWPYKSQLFIPMIISNHPRLTKGTHCDALCGNQDIGATLLDAAGDNKPFGISRSMIGLCDKTVPEREVNLSEFCDSSKTIVDKRYTFIYYPFSTKTCLFDRINDPNEEVNLSGKPEYADLERKFLMHIIDFAAINKRVRVETHDLYSEMKESIEKKDPYFMDTYEVMYPVLDEISLERLKNAGLDNTFNEFCRDKMNNQ